MIQANLLRGHTIFSSIVPTVGDMINIANFGKAIVEVITETVIQLQFQETASGKISQKFNFKIRG